MPTRTRHFVAHFSAPFKLNGFDGLQPAGAYALDQEEELIPDLSRLADRRVAMFMHLPAISAGRWVLQMVPVQAAEIEIAILQDLEEWKDGQNSGHADHGTG